MEVITVVHGLKVQRCLPTAATSWGIHVLSYESGAGSTELRRLAERGRHALRFRFNPFCENVSTGVPAGSDAPAESICGRLGALHLLLRAWGSRVRLFVIDIAHEGAERPDSMALYMYSSQVDLELFWENSKCLSRLLLPLWLSCLEKEIHKTKKKTDYERTWYTAVVPPCFALSTIIEKCQPSHCETGNQLATRDTNQRR